MKPKRLLTLVVGWIAAWMLVLPGTALATQGHAGIEGVWVHQFAHLFFLFSMLLLIYWLRQAGLVKLPGWRYIQYAALFFILWNLDAFFVHLLEEQLAVIDIERIGLWEIRLSAAPQSKPLVWLYYAAKLDHLLCVPALLFLYFGLRRLLKDTERTSSGTVQP